MQSYRHIHNDLTNNNNLFIINNRNLSNQKAILDYILIQNEIIVMIKAIYDNSTRAVLINNTQGKLFRTTVRVIQCCLLSPILLNVFHDNIMAAIQYNYTVKNKGITL